MPVSLNPSFSSNICYLDSVDHGFSQFLSWLMIEKSHLSDFLSVDFHLNRSMPKRLEEAQVEFSRWLLPSVSREKDMGRG